MRDLVARTATAQSIGARVRQEDAVVACSSENGGPALAVLSDGMGGHEDGDLASRIIASEIFGELFVAAARIGTLSNRAGDIFRAALNCANTRLKQHIKAGRLSENTGGTLICATVLEGQLRWLSVGDSWLYVYRRGALIQLNEVHSLGAQLDRMVARDLMDAQTARGHPDRHFLTSAVTGRDIPEIDCPDHGFELETGDVVILASDGIDTLELGEVARLLEQAKCKSSSAIAQTLLDAVADKDAPEQDNSSVIAIKIEEDIPVEIGNLARFGQNVTSLADHARMRLNPTRLRT